MAPCNGHCTCAPPCQNVASNRTFTRDLLAFDVSCIHMRDEFCEMYMGLAVCVRPRSCWQGTDLGRVSSTALARGADAGTCTQRIFDMWHHGPRLVALLHQERRCGCLLFTLSKRGSPVQAKTTRKIVLRLTCNKCKAVHMHALKVRT